MLKFSEWLKQIKPLKPYLSFIKRFMEKFDKRFLRFLIVGGINTLFGYIMFMVFIFLHFHYAIAALFATALGVLFNFKTTGTLVFNNRNNRLLFRFAGIYTVTYFVYLLCLRIFSFYNVKMYLAGAIMALPMAMVSFELNKIFVFVGVKNEAD